MVAELVPILQSSTVNLGCHATGVEKRSWIYGQPFEAIQNFGWRFARCRSLAA